MKYRAYNMKKRAESEEQTRLKITESTVELHGTLGPSRTSVSAIARHAGVRRSTVYRHFPDEAALFNACRSHWLAANPLPDLARWAAIEDSGERLPLALRELYAYYSRTRPMLSNILRDEETMPIVKQMLDGYRAYLGSAREILMNGRRPKRSARPRVRAVIGHVLSFSVWHSLAVEQGLASVQAADLMCRLVAAAEK